MTHMIIDALLNHSYLSRTWSWKVGNMLPCIDSFDTPLWDKAINRESNAGEVL